MKKIILIFLFTAPLFACKEQTALNAIYEQHIRTAQIKDENAYKKLVTKHAVATINKHVSYFKAHGEERSFIDIVHDSVKTDPPLSMLTTYECIKKGSRIMVIYFHKSDKETNILTVIFQKEDHTWKIDEYAESDIPNAHFDAYITFIKNKF